MLVGQFIKNIGGLPCAYVFMALFADALDNLEWKNGFRADGIAMSVYSVIITAASGLVTGIFNGGISGSGYVAPFTATAETLGEVLNRISELGYTLQIDPSALVPTSDGIYTIAVNQPEAVNTAFIFFFVGLEAIAGLVFALMLIPVNVEKNIDRKQLVIRERKKADCLAKGEEWVEPEIRAAEEQKRMDEEAEQAYREELKARCDKKGLDYDALLAKHVKAVEEKERKRLENERIASEKAAAKAKKAEEKRAAKLAAMNEKKLAAFRAGAERKAAREEAAWQREQKEGEALYLKMRNTLKEYFETHKAEDVK